MAVYLVKDKTFKAHFAAITPTKSLSIVNFDVNLLPVLKSANFFSAISASDTSQQKNGLCKNGISVKFTKIRPDDGRKGIISPDGVYYYDVDVSKNPLTVKLQVGGYLLQKQLETKGNEAVKMRVTIDLPMSVPPNKFSATSKKLSLPLDVTGYKFEEKWVMPWSKFFLGVSYLPGTMTIELLDCSDRPLQNVDLVNPYKKILDEKIQSDFSLIAENGKSVSCHTNFLACHSKVFQRMFQTDCKETKEKSCQTGMTEVAVNAFLKFLYYSDVDDAINSSSISLELLQVAHEYDVPALEKTVKLILLEKPSEWYDTGVVVHLFQYALKVKGYEDLKEKAVKVIKSKPDQFRGTAVCDKLFQDDPESAKELFLLCLNK